MKVFLTGATGFLGKHIAKELVDRGHDVTCLVRENSDVADLKLIPARLVKGDVRDYPTLKNHMEGHDAVIHAAAIYKLGQVDKKEMEDVNVKGTENVLLAAVKVKTNKIIYCGSTITLGDTKGQVFDEKSERISGFGSEYERSKFQAEQKVQNFIKLGAPITVVMPSHVYGPGDPHGLGQFITKYIAGEMPVTVNFPYRASFVHVQDAAKGVVDALEKGRPGQSYALAGEEVQWDEFLFLLENYSGVSRPALEIGQNTAKLLAHSSEITSTIFKNTPKVNVESVNHLGRTMIVKNNKAKIELGWIPRPFTQGLKETIDSTQKILARA